MSRREDRMDPPYLPANNVQTLLVTLYAGLGSAKCTRYLKEREGVKVEEDKKRYDIFSVCSYNKKKTLPQFSSVHLQY